MGKIDEALEEALRMKGGPGGLRPVPDVGAYAVPNALTAPPAPHDHPASTMEPPSFPLDTAHISDYVAPVKNPLSVVTEEYRRLVAHILSATDKKSQNTMLVTSAVNGEGKSLTAVNLASAMASKIDHTVLLVDCDLRRPTLHKYLGISPEYGLADCLTGKVAVEKALVRTGIGRMLFLPAGNPVPNPVELLASRKMAEFIREIKNRYRNRYVILDSTPVLATADSMAMAPLADGILFVVRERMASRKEVTHALSLLKGANVLGVIFNCNERQSKSYYSYY